MTQLRRDLLLAGYCLLCLIDLEMTTDDVLTFITAVRIHTRECKEDKVENKLIYLRLHLRRTHSFGNGAALLPALATPDNSKREGLLSEEIDNTEIYVQLLCYQHAELIPWQRRRQQLLTHPKDKCQGGFEEEVHGPAGQQVTDMGWLHVSHANYSACLACRVT